MKAAVLLIVMLTVPASATTAQLTYQSQSREIVAHAEGRAGSEEPQVEHAESSAPDFHDYIEDVYAKVNHDEGSSESYAYQESGLSPSGFFAQAWAIGKRSGNSEMHASSSSTVDVVFSLDAQTDVFLSGRCVILDPSDANLGQATASVRLECDGAVLFHHLIVDVDDSEFLWTGELNPGTYRLFAAATTVAALSETVDADAYFVFALGASPAVATSTLSVGLLKSRFWAVELEPHNKANAAVGILSRRLLREYLEIGKE